METAAIPPPTYPAITRQNDHRRSRITNGSCLLPGVDGRSPWVKRARDLIAAQLSDKPDPSTAEMAIIRRAAVLVVELEIMEAKFASANGADDEALERYARIASSMRRLFESVGLGRRAKELSPLQYAAAVDRDDVDLDDDAVDQ